jgi:lipopolysaccharide export system protein LptC
MEAMFSIIWILAIGWFAVTLANGWQMRSVERDWEALVREHDAPRYKPQHLSQSEVIEVHR